MRDAKMRPPACRRAAALHVAQDGGARALPGARFDLDGERVHVGHMLTHDHQRVALAARNPGVDLREQRRLVKAAFRHNHKFGAARYRAGQRQIAAAAPHHFDDRDALVRRRRIAQTINRIGDHAQRGVKANRHIGTGNIVVDSAGQADARQPFSRQRGCATV